MTKIGRVIALIDEGRLTSAEIGVEVDCLPRFVDHVKRHINLHKANASRSKEVWSDTRVKLLKRCWAEGLSASQTAHRLGGFEHCEDGGRSAVIGKVHRLGLSGRQVRVRKTVARQIRKTGRGPTRRISRSPSKFAHLLSYPMPPSRETDIARVHILDIRDDQCKFIPGDGPGGMCCGSDTVPGTSWCEAHLRRVFSIGESKRPAPVEREKESV